MQDLRVTDTGANGTEVITRVEFALPTQGGTWVLNPSPAAAGWSLTGAGTADDPYVIEFTDPGLTQDQRETILKSFTVTPPGDSSLDGTLTLKVSSEDSNPVIGGPPATATVDLPVRVVVTAQAEELDQDSNGVTGAD